MKKFFNFILFLYIVLFLNSCSSFKYYKTDIENNTEILIDENEFNQNIENNTEILIDENEENKNIENNTKILINKNEENTDNKNTETILPILGYDNNGSVSIYEVKLIKISKIPKISKRKIKK